MARTIVTLLLLLSAGVALLLYVKHDKPLASEELCLDAVDKLYAWHGWEPGWSRSTFRSSVEACKRLAESDVKCIVDESQTARCAAARKIDVEDPQRGFYCFATRVHDTNERRWGKCSFVRQKCEADQFEAESRAYGAKIETCQWVEHLFGIRSGEDSWYGLTPDPKECVLFLRKHAKQLQNIDSHCTKVLAGGKTGEAIDNPKRPTPLWSGKKPSRLWCLSSVVGPSQCFVEQGACEEARIASERSMSTLTYECKQRASGYFLNIGATSTLIYADREMCEMIASANWEEGRDASTCTSL
jgi:hypothetical protein